MDCCPKIQVDHGLMELDCEPCGEKSFCGFRSNSLKWRLQQHASEVQHIAWLRDLKEVVGLNMQQLSGWEISALVLFERAVNHVQIKEHEFNTNAEGKLRDSS